MKRSTKNRLGVSVIGGAVAAPLIGLAYYTHEAIDERQQYESDFHALKLIAAEKYGYAVGTLGINNATIEKDEFDYYDQAEKHESERVAILNYLLIVEAVGALAVVAGTVNYVVKQIETIPTRSVSV